MTLATNRAIALCAALFLGGCASEGGSHKPTASADNPANPNAPAAPQPPQAFTLLKLAGPPHRAPAATAPASHSNGAYVCPMHPEVTSNKPGTCPKCKMELEPHKPGAPATTPASSASPSGGHEVHEHDHGGHP